MNHDSFRQGEGGGRSPSGALTVLLEREGVEAGVDVYGAAARSTSAAAARLTSVAGAVDIVGEEEGRPVVIGEEEARPVVVREEEVRPVIVGEEERLGFRLGDRVRRVGEKGRGEMV
jgi:hypothetical protein